MRSLWPSLRATFARSIDTIEFRRSFGLMRQSHTELRRFDDPTNMLDFLHARSGDFDEKDRILTGLIEMAKQHDITGDHAMTLLWLAFWPGLDAIYRRRLRHFGNEPDELTSEIADRFILAVKRFEQARVRRVAATVLRNVERNICDGLRHERERAAHVVDVAIDEIMDRRATGASGSRLGLPPAIAPDEAVVHLERLLKKLIGQDADLVITVAVLGERQRDAAARLSLASEAARKRYQRALSRLRSQLAA
jgi:RNA polymerase sigma-70 factor (ECF subfamily)